MISKTISGLSMFRLAKIAVFYLFFCLPSLAYAAPQFTLEIDTLNLRISSLEEEFKVTVEAKDKEIDALHDLVKSHSPSNNVWWAIGGAAVGVATTAFVVHVAK